MKTNLLWQKACQWFSVDGGKDDQGEEGITKGHEKTLDSIGYFHYLDSVDGSTSVPIFQNLLNCIL